MINSKWFKQEELECKCGCGLYIPNQELLDVLDDVRDYFGVPVTVTSGTRCKVHNAEIGGRVNSQHLLGTASDIQVKGVSPELVASYLEEEHPSRYGIGEYDTFVHIDVRKGKGRWFG